MLISVVTVMYNPILDELKKTMESILSQDFVDFEYIIQDGGSDNLECLEYVKNVESNSDNVRFYEKNDRGIYEGMNNALKKCCGKYVLFINVGDLLLSDKSLSLYSKALSDKPDILVDLDLLYGESKSHSLRLKQKMLSKFVLRNLCHQTYLTKYEFCYFDEKLKYSADFKMLQTSLFTKLAKVSYVNQCQVFYQSGGVSDQNLSLVYKEIISTIFTIKDIPLYIRLFNIFLFYVRLARHKL